MHKHIDLLGLLYIVAAGLAALVSAATLSLGLGALSIGWRAEAGAAAIAAEVTAVTFLATGILLAVWSGINAWAGRALRRRSAWARLCTMVLAVLNLFILPFGTALGVYSLWVLLHNESRSPFETGG